MRLVASVKVNMVVKNGMIAFEFKSFALNARDASI